MKQTNTLIVQWQNITLKKHNEEDYISLTDIAKRKNPDAPADIVKNWMRVTNTIQYLWLWEKFHNSDFKLVEFDGFKNSAWENSFVLSPQKWIESTNAIWIISKSGRYGWTYAHKDIAFKFASWISVEFELYIIQEFQRLKSNEQEKLVQWWDVKREIAKVNYKIHTDAIKNYLLPTLWAMQKLFAYADEADLLNVLVFGKTARMWHDENPDLSWNMRDYANALDLIILSNIESFNAEYLEQWLSQEERYQNLKSIITKQRTSLENKKLTTLKT